MSLLDEAAAWARENPEEVPAPPVAPSSPATPPPPPSEQPKASTAPPEPAAAPELDDEPSATAMPMEDIAELAVAAVDFGIQNFISPRCAYKPQQKAELARLGTKVLEKWFPDLEGAVEPEYAFLGALGLFAYANYTSSPDPVDGASPPGGNAAGGSSGGSTEASVDGRSVKAEVLQ